MLTNPPIPYDASNQEKALWAFSVIIKLRVIFGNLSSSSPPPPLMCLCPDTSFSGRRWSGTGHRKYCPASRRWQIYLAQTPASLIRINLVFKQFSIYTQTTNINCYGSWHSEIWKSENMPGFSSLCFIYHKLNNNNLFNWTELHSSDVLNSHNIHLCTRDHDRWWTQSAQQLGEPGWCYQQQQEQCVLCTGHFKGGAVIKGFERIPM